MQNLPEEEQKSVRKLSLSGRHDEAIACARRLVSANLLDVNAHLMLGRSLLEANNKKEALIVAENAVKLDGRNAEALFFAGSVASQLHMYEIALAHLESASLLNKTDARPHIELANCYKMIFRSAKASEHYRTAIDLSPAREEKDSILIMLANHLTTANERTKSKEIFQQILERKGPRAIDAAIALSELKKDGTNTVVGRRLAKFSNDPKANPAAKARVLFALGKLHENEKQFDRAFGCWQSAQALLKSSIDGLRDHPFSLSQTDQSYPPDIFRQLKHSGNQAYSPVFIAGMPRSGTTLLEQIISSHSEAEAAGEVGRWDDLRETFFGEIGTQSLSGFALNVVNQNILRRYGNEIVRILEFVSNSKAKKIVEKTPRAMASMGFIKLCCPNTKFIHILRHPLDSFISSYQSSFASGHTYARDQLEYAKEYVWHLLMMRLWQQRFPENILTVKYEDLVRDPEIHARKIIHYIGLEWEDTCLDFYKSNRPVLTLSTSQVRQPIHDKSIGRWKKYAQHLGPLMDHLKSGGVNWDREC